MTVKVRTVACTALLLLFSGISVFASSTPLRIVIKPVSDRVQAIRFQTGVEETDRWALVPASNPLLVLEAFDSSKDRLFVQQSLDKQSWSSSYEYRYSPSDKRWTVTPSEADSSGCVESLDVKVYSLFPLSRSSTYYSYVIGSGLKLNITVDKQEKLAGYAEVAYSRGPSKSDWVDTMQAVNLSVGMGYRVALADRLQLTPELGYGVVLHLLNADFDQDGTKTFEPFVDQQIRLSLNLGYELNDSYTLLIAPLGVVFFEKNTIGTLLGIQTSLRFNF